MSEDNGLTTAWAETLERMIKDRAQEPDIRMIVAPLERRLALLALMKEAQSASVRRAIFDQARLEGMPV